MEEGLCCSGRLLGCQGSFCFLRCLRCLVEEVASSRTVWPTHTGLRMCGNPCGAELRSTEQLLPSFPLLSIGGSGSREVCSPLHPHPGSLPTHMSHCHVPFSRSGRKMGTENPKAEPGLRLPLPGLLRTGWGHRASECPALALVSPPSWVAQYSRVIVRI